MTAATAWRICLHRLFTRHENHAPQFDPDAADNISSAYLRSNQWHKPAYDR